MSIASFLMLIAHQASTMSLLKVTKSQLKMMIQFEGEVNLGVCQDDLNMLSKIKGACCFHVCLLARTSPCVQQKESCFPFLIHIWFGKFIGAKPEFYVLLRNKDRKAQKDPV